MVHHQDENMIFGSELDNGGAEAGFGLEMERVFRFFHQQAFHFGIAVAGGQVLQVDPFQFERPVAVNDSNRFSLNCPDRAA
jgi:hypothetical protein